MTVSLILLLASWGGGYSTSATGGEWYCDMPASRLSSTDYNFKVLDRWPYGSGFSVLLDSNILYYTNGAVLQTGRLDAQGKVDWLSELVFPGLAYTMVQRGQRLYVAVDDQGIAIVDVSSPDNPDEITLFPTSGRVFGLEARGDTVYAALGNAGLEIFDCKDGLNPKLVGALTGFNLRSLSLDGGYLFASDASIGLITIDVSDPSSPNLTKSLKLSGQHYGLALDTLGNKAWICSFDGGIHVVDVSNPLAPTSVATIPIFFSWAVDIKPPYAYVVTWTDSLDVMDLATMSKMYSTDFGGLDSTGVWAYDVSVSKGFCAVAGLLGSWWIFDISSPPGIAIVDGQAKGGLSEVVTADERWFVLGMQGAKLAVFERDKTLEPAAVIAISDWPRDATIYRDTLFVAESWSGLSLYNIKNPLTGVKLISRFNPDEVHVWGLALDLPYAYLACGDSGLIIVDLSEPLNIKRVAKVTFDVRAFSIYCYKKTIFLGLEDASVAEVDAGNPADPVYTGRHVVAGTVVDMLIGDSLACLAESNMGLGIYDVSGSQWKRLSLTPSMHVTFSLDISGNVIFLADGSGGLSAYDISNPSLPHLVGRLNTGGEARALLVLKDTLILADGYDGLERIVFLNLGTEESNPQIIAGVFAWPNPCSKTLHFTKHVNAGIYDESGRFMDYVNGRTYNTVKLHSGTYFLVGKGWVSRFVKIDSRE